MHVRVRHEVYGLFAACIPQESRQRADGMSVRKRQGLVPDFLFHALFDGAERPLLFELKCLHFGNTTYPRSAARCSAVERRALALPAEYAGKARAVDRQFCGSQQGQVGPVEQRLNTFEPVRGLVFGAWGEASPAAGKLLSLFAASGAARHWRAMRQSTPADPSMDAPAQMGANSLPRKRQTEARQT